MPRIHLHRLTKTFPNGHAAVRALDLEVEDGELMVLVGPSGSGKSTVLRMIAGLEEPTSGRIEIGGREVTRLPPRERDVAMVFQSYALYPHMTVAENLGFGLRMRGAPRAERERRVREVADALGLEALLGRRPAQLSGGQRQRVALGRAIAREPAAFLFDEPLSNLDARLRVETRAELARLHRRLGTTAVYVTHDQTEAMTLGRRVAVLRGGELQQVAPPMEMYRDPANRFVGGFLGSPGMSFLRGAVERTEGGAAFRTGAGTVPLDPARLGEAEGEAWLGVRPHRLEIVAGGEDGGLAARVLVVEPLGSEQVVRMETADGQPLAAVVAPDLPVRPDQAVRLRVPPEAAHLFRAPDGRRVSPDLAGP